MQLNLVLARNNISRPRFLADQIRTDFARSSRPVYVIVPEQFTLQAERELIKALGAEGFLQLRINSITALSDDIFENTSRSLKTVVDSRGREMALRNVAMQNAHRLKTLAGSIRFPGFISELSSLLSEFKQNDVELSSLSTACSTDNQFLNDKLQDISLLWEEFDTFLAQVDFQDQDDRLNECIRHIPEAAELLQGCSFYFYGFSYFTRRECRMILELLHTSRSVTVLLLTAARGDGDAYLFALMEEIRAYLAGAAEEMGAEVHRIYPDLRLYAKDVPPILRRIEKQLFLRKKNVSALHSEDVCLVKAGNEQEETEAAAAWILTTLRERNARFSDFSIIVADMETYGPVINRVFRRYGIPCFVDQKHEATGHPAVRFLIRALQALHRNCSIADMTAVFKSGVFGFTNEECDVLEEYVRSFNIRGWRGWNEPWKRGVQYYDLTALNELREKITAPLGKMRKALAKGSITGSQWSVLLFELLNEMNIQEYLAELAGELDEEGIIEEAAVTRRIWNMLLELLEQFDVMLSQTELDAGEIAAIVEDGIAAEKIGIIPTAADQVQFGDISRSKHSDTPYILLLGAGEGAFQTGGGENAVLLDHELRQLGENILLCRGSKQKQIQYAMDLYQTITSCTQRIYVSWRAFDDNGESTQEDTVVDRLMGIGGLNRGDILLGEQLYSRPIHREGSFAALPQTVRMAAEGIAPDPAVLHLMACYNQDSNYTSRLESLLTYAAGDFDTPEELPQVARAMGGFERVSPSQLESYDECPLQFFFDRVLRPSRPRRYEVDAVNAGMYLHSAMELFGKSYPPGFDFTRLDRKKALLEMNQIADELRGSFDFGVLDSGERMKFRAKLLKDILMSSTDTWVRQMKLGQFQPLGMEIAFGRGRTPSALLPVQDEKPALLEGRIDRIDLFPREQTDYLRVVDYKSGNATINDRDALNGLSIQTWLYAYALESIWPKLNQREGKTAAAYIFSLSDPWTSQQENREQARKKALLLRGWCLEDGFLLQAHDRSLSEGRKSEIIPTASTSIKTAKEVESISAIVVENAGQTVASMRRGRIAPHPWRDGVDKACNRCAWKSGCRFNLYGQQNYRRLLTREQAAESIAQRMVSTDGVE